MERNSDKVIALVVDGQSDTQIAISYSVSHQAVTKFRTRHVAEIAAAKEQLAVAVLGITIAEKKDRIEAKNDRWQRARQVIADRAADPRYAAEPGYDTGLLVHTFKSIGAGENAYTVDEFAVDTGLLAQIQALEHEAALELDQLPRANLIVDNSIKVLIREISGFRADQIG